MTDPETDPETDPMREFARSLFARGLEDDETDEPDEPPVANLVPKEGNNPNPDKDMRAFVRDLFGDDLNFRNT